MDDMDDGKTVFFVLLNMAHRFENVCEIILDLEGESKEKKFTRSYNFTKKKNGEMEAKGIFNDVLVSSTLTLPVNIFTWKKETPPPGGGGTPIHNLYGYVPPKGVVILKLLV